ncbi:MAG: hypothetical protein LBE78_13095 [Burkholderiaceae bacterium]|jgi:hypothetical protein|nr:hypothetical protein [Burkholderiaceae bacterium]
MPIRPENLHRYPAAWPDIRQRILERAGYRCEHPGCGARHLELGYWADAQWIPLPLWMRQECGVYRPCSVGGVKIIEIVLTIAHLDHTPENCADDNLRAMCQRHHLEYDAAHHAVTRARTRHANADTMEMFP